jgi:hypothetical protein
MKSGFLLTLIICLTGSALEVDAQEPTERPQSSDLRVPASEVSADRLSRAAAREAARFAAAAEPLSSGLDAVPQGDTTPDARSDWSRVPDLAPGTRILVTRHGSQPLERFVVSADETELIVLDLTDPTLPGAVTRALLNVASNHPEYFATRPNAGQFVERAVRLGPDGVFVADRRVAALEQLVEISTRTEVAEITIRRKGRGVWGHLGPLGGYFVGAMVGGYAAGFACQAAVGRDRCDTGAFLRGMVGGGIAGGAFGFRASNRETEDVVYRAP